LTDPQATWVARPGVDPFFAYDANYLIDNKAGIILDAEGTRANRPAEIAITETMVERVRRRFDLRPQRLAGDTVYGAVKLLKWLVDRKITPHVPVWDRSARHDGTFSRADFVFDHKRNIYVCPGGAELTSTGNIDQGHIVYYRANKNDCAICSLKPKCTTAVVRKVTDRILVLDDGRSVEEGPSSQVTARPRTPTSRLLIDAATAFAPADDDFPDNPAALEECRPRRGVAHARPSRWNRRRDWDRYRFRR